MEGDGSLELVGVEVDKRGGLQGLKWSDEVAEAEKVEGAVEVDGRDGGERKGVTWLEGVAEAEKVEMEW